MVYTLTIIRRQNMSQMTFFFLKNELLDLYQTSISSDVIQYRHMSCVSLYNYFHFCRSIHILLSLGQALHPKHTESLSQAIFYWHSWPKMVHKTCPKFLLERFDDSCHFSLGDMDKLQLPSSTIFLIMSLPLLSTIFHSVYAQTPN